METAVALWRRRDELDPMPEIGEAFFGLADNEPGWLTKLIDWGMALRTGSSPESNASLPCLLRRRQTTSQDHLPSLRSHSLHPSMAAPAGRDQRHADAIVEDVPGIDNRYRTDQAAGSRGGLQRAIARLKQGARSG
jgi:hypothetical protein